ncbi:MgtC/SapB family protein [Actinocrinis puniceicyclus]|uniref:MgtC/SapB family protein n=1 Tax=Actinocrinis puniceicyclus TaxID=977794 RepID=A0A8J7WMY2_9ACTN|nr:MgtC/SapB family protein [Actinocrinis puniceicyclus]MBS2965336.1 MgtC/SapB family protein [Actinocrinis puniceicyclus]
MVTLGAPLWSLSDAQGARQFTELGVALLLSTLIGLEREAKQKSAGLRTHALVGVGSALFMEVSQHGFAGALLGQHVSYDPSRVAAQIVTGIGFIGGGLIFVRRDAVRGLTTAATIWLTCAIGMACGGGLVLIAAAVTGGHFVIVRGYPLIIRRLPWFAGGEPTELELSYRVGTGLLQRALEQCTAAGFRILDVHVLRGADRQEAGSPREFGVSHVMVLLDGTHGVEGLVAQLENLDGMLSIAIRSRGDAAE